MIDHVTASVLRGALESISDEMDSQLIRSAISPIISETNDCAHGIYHPVTGETIAQGRVGLPVFMANMQFTVQAVIERAAAVGGFEDGDVWILNDPYLGGTHLSDVNLVVPYFWKGELVALFANTGHWMDIGGSVSGGWAPKATDIHQEGLVIPPVKLYERGVLNTALVEMFRANVRLPNQIAGDLSAMVNVFKIGREGLDRMLETYGLRTMQEIQSALVEASERQMRSHITDIPDGVYQAEDWLDNDGLVDVPLRLAVRVEVSGDEMDIDFAGTCDAATGPMNLGRNTTISSVYVALKHIFPDVPVSGGTFRPVHCHVPDGSLLAARYPSPVGGYLEPVGRVLDLVMGTLAQAVPDRVPAAAFGTTGVVTISGTHPTSQQYFVGVFPYPGGYGGSPTTDGLVHGTTPQSMANFMSLEASEHRYPIRFERFGLREDSGGAGRQAGGCGTSYAFRATAPCHTSVLGDRADKSPQGVGGGGEALANEVRLLHGGEQVVPPMRSKIDSEPLDIGDGVQASSPGGAGWGDPLLREPELVRRDLERAYISAETAAERYGVVLVPTEIIAGHRRFVVDEEATRKERAGRRVRV